MNPPSLGGRGGSKNTEHRCRESRRDAPPIWCIGSIECSEVPSRVHMRHQCIFSTLAFHVTQEFQLILSDCNISEHPLYLKNCLRVLSIVLAVLSFAIFTQPYLENWSTKAIKYLCVVDTKLLKINNINYKSFFCQVVSMCYCLIPL